MEEQLNKKEEGRKGMMKRVSQEREKSKIREGERRVEKGKEQRTSTKQEEGEQGRM